LTANGQEKVDVSAGDAAKFEWSENEKSVAQWVFDKSQMAGAGSDTLSAASGLYLPLKGLRTTVGVLGVRPKEPQILLEPEQLQLLERFAGEIGGALESTRMSEAIGRAETELELQAIKNPKADVPLRLEDVLGEERILFLQDGLSKEQILRELLSRLQ